MKMIVVTEDQWELEWEKMRLELERALKEPRTHDALDGGFRTANYHLISLKQRLERK